MTNLKPRVRACPVTTNCWNTDCMHSKNRTAQAKGSAHPATPPLPQGSLKHSLPMFCVSTTIWDKKKERRDKGHNKGTENRLCWRGMGQKWGGPEDQRQPEVSVSFLFSFRPLSQHLFWDQCKFGDLIPLAPWLVCQTQSVSGTSENTTERPLAKEVKWAGVGGWGGPGVRRLGGGLWGGVGGGDEGY